MCNSESREAFVWAKSWPFRWVPAALLIGALLANSAALAQPRLIRNCTPAAWQTDDVQWIRDVAPHNKVDDRIDASSALLVDVLVNFNRCVVAADLTALANLCPSCGPAMRSRYISTVGLKNVPRAAINALRLLPGVAFIEEQLVATANLDTSVPSICITPGSSSCAGNVDTNFGFDGNGVTIAIMDTGVDNNNHNAFAATTLVGGYDATLPVPAEVDPIDVNGHGTHVASIALGQAAGAVSRGVAPAANLVDVKVIGALSADVCGALEKIYDETAWNVKVINMSFGFTDALGNPVPADGTEAFSQLIDLGESMGIVVVVAAGNSGPGNQALGQPAAATRAITVAASDDGNTTVRGDDGLASFSSVGPRDNDGDLDALDELKPEVTAPGTNIFAALRGTTNSGINKSGTSMAAPHVAGLAALIGRNARKLSHPTLGN